MGAAPASDAYRTPERCSSAGSAAHASTALATCWIGIVPSEWYTLINAHVFFWLDPARLNRQRAAYDPHPQVVLTVDASKLVAASAEKMAVTQINTGNACRCPARQGAATFVPHAAWITSAWAGEAASLGAPVRPSSHLPVGLTVAGSISDSMQFVVGVQQWHPVTCHARPSVI